MGDEANVFADPKPGNQSDRIALPIQEQMDAEEFDMYQGTLPAMGYPVQIRACAVVRV